MRDWLTMPHVASIGLEVHARSIKGCAFNPFTGEIGGKPLLLRPRLRRRLDPFYRVARGSLRVRRHRLSLLQGAALPRRGLRHRRGLQDAEARGRQATQDRQARRRVFGQAARTARNRRGPRPRLRVRGRQGPLPGPCRCPGEVTVLPSSSASPSTCPGMGSATPAETTREGGSGRGPGRTGPGSKPRRWPTPRPSRPSTAIRSASSGR